MKVALCDDEVEVLQDVETIVKELGHEVDCYQDGNILLEKEYPIYILDIGMKQMDGITLGMNLRKKYPTCCIVYVTNFDDYRAQAFGVHAFDYLKKPVKKEDLRRVFDDVKKVLAKEQSKCSFHTKEGTLCLHVDDILYFEYAGRNVLLHTKTKTYVMKETMHTIADQMKPYHFIMPHKSFCIHLKNVKLVKGYDITMVNGDILPLSQKRSAVFRNALNDFLFQQLHEAGL